MLRVGIVAEGKADWFVLEEIMRALFQEIEFERLRPDMTLVSRSSFGWRGVKAWCNENRARLETLLSGVKDRPIHLLVIHVDCSMAHNEGVAYPCPPPSLNVNALRSVVLDSWFGLPALPGFIVFATPSMTSDTWVVAALEPSYEPDSLECDERVERELVARGLLRTKDGEVKKPEKRYRPLVAQMIRELNRVRERCPEADRFCSEFGSAVAALGDELSL
jgi:hypothetical protein